MSVFGLTVTKPLIGIILILFDLKIIYMTTSIKAKLYLLDCKILTNIDDTAFKSILLGLNLIFSKIFLKITLDILHTHHF